MKKELVAVGTISFIATAVGPTVYDWLKKRYKRKAEWKARKKSEFRERQILISNTNKVPPHARIDQASLYEALFLTQQGIEIARTINSGTDPQSLLNNEEVPLSGNEGGESITSSVAADRGAVDNSETKADSVAQDDQGKLTPTIESVIVTQTRGTDLNTIEGLNRIITVKKGVMTAGQAVRYLHQSAVEQAIVGAYDEKQALLILDELYPPQGRLGPTPLSAWHGPAPTSYIFDASVTRQLARVDFKKPTGRDAFLGGGNQTALQLLKLHYIAQGKEIRDRVQDLVRMVDQMDLSTEEAQRTQLHWYDRTVFVNGQMASEPVTVFAQDAYDIFTRKGLLPERIEVRGHNKILAKLFNSGLSLSHMAALFTATFAFGFHHGATPLMRAAEAASATAPGFVRNVNDLSEPITTFLKTSVWKNGHEGTYTRIYK